MLALAAAWCASQTRNLRGSAGHNRTKNRISKPNLALRLKQSTSLLPVVTPEAPLLPGGAFSVVETSFASSCPQESFSCAETSGRAAATYPFKRRCARR